MKGERVREFFRKTAVKVASITLAAAVVAGSSMWYETTQITTPELVTFVDMDESVAISEDAVPLATPKVTTSTKTKKTTKTVKLKTASKKTYTQKSSSKKTTTKKSSTTASSTTTKTVVATTVNKKYTKKSKNMKQTTTVKTTVTKTVTPKTTAKVTNGTVKISTAAPKVDKKVSDAFTKLGFKIVVNSKVSYSGLFDARSQTITLKTADATVYHELGHFVAFAAGNVDTSASFQKVFAKEKSKYTAYNKAYVLSNSSEYFAESYKNYVENPSALKKERPETYAAVQKAVNSLTTAQVTKIATVYKAIWK